MVDKVDTAALEAQIEQTLKRRYEKDFKDLEQ
jgi:hypothetical protein